MPCGRPPLSGVMDQRRISLSSPAEYSVGLLGSLLKRICRIVAVGASADGRRIGLAREKPSPNWAEAVSIIWAGFRIGAVMVPIVHFYGAGEVEFILRQSGAKLLVTVDRFGHVDHVENLRAIRERLPALEHVVVVASGTPGAPLPGALALDALLEAPPFTAKPAIDPDRPAMVGYTSGTTASPKGVEATPESGTSNVPAPVKSNRSGPNLASACGAAARKWRSSITYSAWPVRCSRR